ncbi:hypothetical protein DENSPDRAFT_88776 [Dentipellis sp. KUC8613]|nr:hypothetical protein DENSPDRAFT_88776 [Dentipellis sp. KUC8613]
MPPRSFCNFGRPHWRCWRPAGNSEPGVTNICADYPIPRAPCQSTARTPCLRSRFPVMHAQSGRTCARASISRIDACDKHGVGGDFSRGRSAPAGPWRSSVYVPLTYLDSKLPWLRPVAIGSQALVLHLMNSSGSFLAMRCPCAVNMHRTQRTHALDAGPSDRRSCIRRAVRERRGGILNCSLILLFQARVALQHLASGPFILVYFRDSSTPCSSGWLLRVDDLYALGLLIAGNTESGTPCAVNFIQSASPDMTVRGKLHPVASGYV